MVVKPHSPSEQQTPGTPAASKEHLQPVGLTPSVQGVTTERIHVNGDGTLTVVLDILPTGAGETPAPPPSLGMDPPLPQQLPQHHTSCLPLLIKFLLTKKI